VKRRTVSLGLLAGLVLSAGLVAGCSSGGGGKEELGTLNLPLVTHGPSGAEYRLRNATFEISNLYYYDDYGSGGDGGTSAPPITLSSEDDPTATSLSVSVERGYYYVRLLPGWHLEKVDASGATEVEATLLSSATQSIYVYQHESTWVEYEFGIGDRALWFNGQLNIDIVVHEDPSEIYGNTGGFGGAEGDVDCCAGAGGQ
jgi:hypothetical protein